MPAQPIDAATNVFARAKAVTGLTPTGDANVDADLLRHSLVLGVAALDTYLHWKVRRVPLAQLTKSLKRLPITFDDMVASGRKSVDARKANVNDRPDTRARTVLNRELLKRTFQSPRGVDDAVGFLGAADFWRHAAAAMPGSPTPKDVQSRLQRIADHRNRIVHEGDLKRLARPQTVKCEPVDAAAVADDVDWLEAFVTAIDSVI